MKKLILILLTIMPVAIIALTSFSAKEISKEIKEYNIFSAEFDYNGFGISYLQKRIYLNKGESVDLAPYIAVYPKKSDKFKLIFQSDFPDIVSVDYVKEGKREKLLLRAHANMIPDITTGYIVIVCKSDDATMDFFVLNVQVNWLKGE